MQNLNPRSYVQYANLNGSIKTVPVQRNIIDNEIHFVMPPIQEDFFILGLYDHNKRVFGVTFFNVTNLDNLGFLNSEFQTLEAIPELAFNQANSQITIVKDFPVLDFPFIQDVNVKNDTPIKVEPFPFYDPYNHFIDLNLGNTKIEGVSIGYDSSTDEYSAFFIDTLNNGQRSYSNMNYDLRMQISSEKATQMATLPSIQFNGFTIFFPIGDNEGEGDFCIDFLLDTQYNIFDVVQSLRPAAYNPVVTPFGLFRGFHKFDIDLNTPVFVSYKMDPGTPLTIW